MTGDPKVLKLKEDKPKVEKTDKDQKGEEEEEEEGALCDVAPTVLALLVRLESTIIMIHY